MNLLMPIMSMMQDVGSPPNGGESVPFSAVELLINAEAQGATADDFIDLSTAARTITRNSSDTRRSSSAGVPVYGSYGIELAAASGRTDFTVGAAADWTFLHDATDKWTIDFRLDPADFSTTRVLFDTSGGTTTNAGIYVQYNSSRVILVQMYRAVNSSFVINGSFTALDNNTNYRHLRLNCDLSLASANMELFENGVSKGTLNKTANAPSSADPPYPFRFGGHGPSGGSPLRGSIDELRIVKGYALPALLQDTAWPTS